LTVQEAAVQSPERVLAALGSSPEGLPAGEVVTRREAVGPNAVRNHHARALAVLARQLRNALLALLLVTAIASFFLGERTDAVIIALILAVSVGLGFGFWRTFREIEGVPRCGYTANTWTVG
jgi:Mg2+-importing ATPase